MMVIAIQVHPRRCDITIQYIYFSDISPLQLSQLAGQSKGVYLLIFYTV